MYISSKKANEPCFSYFFLPHMYNNFIHLLNFSLPFLLALHTTRAWEFFSCSKNSLPCRHICEAKCQSLHIAHFYFPFFLTHSLLYKRNSHSFSCDFSRCVLRITVADMNENINKNHLEAMKTAVKDIIADSLRRMKWK